MRAAEAIQRTEEWTFEMVAADGFSNEGIGFAELLDALELPAQRIRLRADQRHENPMRLVRMERNDRAAQFREGQFRALEVRSGKSVHLQIEKLSPAHESSRIPTLPTCD